jgi:hypothetical protein
MATPFFYLDDTKDLNVSPQLWVYLAVAVPLTGCTMGYWQWSVRRKKLERSRTLDISVENKV